MMPLAGLLADLESDPALEQPMQVLRRIDALDRIEAVLLQAHGVDASLQSRAERLCQRLDATNAKLFEAIRADLRGGHEAGRLLQWLSRLEPATKQIQGGNGYDSLDELVSGVLRFEPPRAPEIALAPDMVFYQPTPARHVFDLVARTGLREGDVLVDLGSGLGHVPLLVAACTRADAVGVELEPAYVACARQAASELGLRNVRFVERDARRADLSTGTVFYLYTPFKGAILREVLDRLRGEASRRAIRVCTFGPCTAEVAGEPWLSSDDAAQTDRIAVFRSWR